MAADETLHDGDEDSQSVMLVGEDTGVEWPDVEPSQAAAAAAVHDTSTAAGGRRLDAALDEDAVFGQLIVCELRHVADPTTKLVLRHNILTMIYETRLQGLQGGVSAPHAPRRGGTRLPTVNGCWSVARPTRSSVDSAERRQNFDEQTMTIKGEAE